MALLFKQLINKTSTSATILAPIKVALRQEHTISPIFSTTSVFSPIWKPLENESNLNCGIQLMGGKANKKTLLARKRKAKKNGKQVSLRYR